MFGALVVAALGAPGDGTGGNANGPVASESPTAEPVAPAAPKEKDNGKGKGKGKGNDDDDD
jgi:hypothetical protein